MKGYLTVQQASVKSGYCRRWIRTLIRQGKIKAIKKGKYYYLSPVSLKTYLAKQGKHKRRGRPRKDK